MAVKKAKGTAVTNWDEELAKYAKESAEMEANVGGGSFFSVKSGVLSWQDNPLPGNEMAVIIIDSIMENAFYPGAYDIDNPQPPSCFAFGRKDEDMAPHEIVVKAGNQENDVCLGCPNNEFGSADTGKGKACKNTRRLALIPAGKFKKDGSFEFIEDVDHYESTEVGFMKLPVTSIKGYASFVKQTASALNRPPFGIVTRISVVPDTKSQFKVLFEPLMNVPDELIGVILSRNKSVATEIDFPYALPEEDPEPKKGGKKTAAKPVAKKRKY